jgi:hypothetical protein
MSKDTVSFLFKVFAVLIADTSRGNGECYSGALGTVQAEN